MEALAGGLAVGKAGGGCWSLLVLLLGVLMLLLVLPLRLLGADACWLDCVRAFLGSRVRLAPFFSSRGDQRGGRPQRRLFVFSSASSSSWFFFLSVSGLAFSCYRRLDWDRRLESQPTSNPPKEGYDSNGARGSPGEVGWIW